MVGMQGKMPCVSGLLVAKELQAFRCVLDPESKKTPLTAIVGGAKISDKVLVVDNSSTSSTVRFPARMRIEQKEQIGWEERIGRSFV